MKIATATTLALAVLSALSGCAQGEPKPAVTTATVQRCVQVVPVGGHVLLADDDECEDHPEKYIFWYGGVTIVTSGSTRLQGGSRVAPASAFVAVRHPDKGGSWRTRGRAMSHNEEVSRRLNVSLPYDANKANPKTPTSFGDDKRQPAPVKVNSGSNRTRK